MAKELQVTDKHNALSFADEGSYVTVGISEDDFPALYFAIGEGSVKQVIDFLTQWHVRQATGLAAKPRKRATRKAAK